MSQSKGKVSVPPSEKKFRDMNHAERLQRMSQELGLTKEETRTLYEGRLRLRSRESLTENVVGRYTLYLKMAENFVINGRTFPYIPMVTEEPSVVAAASYGAKIARPYGGFTAKNTGSVMLGQIQIVHVPEMEKAIANVLEHKKELMDMADSFCPNLVAAGGGMRDLTGGRKIDTERGPMLIVELVVDCRDAMGANAIDTMAEGISSRVMELVGVGKQRARILSNLADKRLVTVSATFGKNELSREGYPGEEVVEGILDLYHFAYNDVYRAATHNKGVMNGVAGVAQATGQDIRALEAGAHAFAARDGKYRPLTTYSKDADGNIVGFIEMPMAVGTIGGDAKSHPIADINIRRILRPKGATELAEIHAAVGLSQNFAALRALVSEGIQEGHMKMHRKKISESEKH